MLYRVEDITSIGVMFKGPLWGFPRLRVGCNLDSMSEAIALAMLKHLEGRRDAWDVETNANNAKTILALALAWKRPDLWNRAIRHCGPALEAVKTEVAKASNVFDLDSIKPSYVMFHSPRACRLIVL